MKKHLKTFIFTALACTLLLGAGISAEAAEKIRIDDSNFARAVKEQAVKADANGDGYLSKKEASKVTKIHFFAPHYNIDSFQGIKYFSNLKDFYYRADNATFDYDDINIYESSTAREIDLSGLKKLENVTIDSRNSYLRTVNLEDCVNLKNVTIEGRRDGCLDKLNLNGCTNLRTLNLDMTDLTKVNLSGFKKLTEVSIYDARQKLKTVNWKKCSKLTTLLVSGDCLSNVKLKGATALEKLDLTGRSMKSLDVTTNTQLTDLSLGWGTTIPTLDLSKNKKLTTLYCYTTELVSLDLSKNTNLIDVKLRNNPKLIQLNTKGCKKLKTLFVEHTGLTNLNIKKNPNLQKLSCYNNKLTKLNLKNNKKLKRLNCGKTDIRELDLSNTKIRKPNSLKCDPDVTVTYAK